MYKNLLLTICLIFSMIVSHAEIIVEYKVTPLKENPFLEASEVLPYQLVLIVGEKYARLETRKAVSFTNQFQLYPIEGDHFYQCIFGGGISNKFKVDRVKFDIISTSSASYNVLGSACKKIIAEKNGKQIEIYSTTQYGVDFYPYADIEGIPLLIIEDDRRFGKVVYEATRVTTQEISDDLFDISDYSLETVDAEPDPHIGKIAKPVKLKTLEGDKAELDFTDGKIYVLNFWFKGCAPCIQEMPLLNKVVDSLASEKVKFIAISTDPPKTASGFLEKTEFNYEHYASGHSAATRFDVSSFPTHIVINEEGKIQYYSSGLSSYSIYSVVYAINQLTENDQKDESE